MERIRKRKGSLIMQRFFRKLHKHHAQILKELKYYKGENE